MPGFRITNINTAIPPYSENGAKFIKDSAKVEGWTVDRVTLDKFAGDKIFTGTGDHFIILEGVVLNKKDLVAEFGGASWADTVEHMINGQGDDWFRLLNGPVSGAVYFKKSGRWTIFTGKLGEKAIYHYHSGQNIIIGSQLKYITDIMKEQDIDRMADENAICHFGAYGSYIGSETCITDVKRLYPGHYLTVEDGNISVKEYASFDVRQDEGGAVLSESKYIEKLHGAFTSAMQRILDKDREYGYRTLLDLSGGYDSRMNAYVLNDVRKADDPVLAQCYGQTGCHDAKVSESITSELGYTYLFMSLDNADCMYGLDDNIRMLNGATIYFGITGGRDALARLSGGDIGLEITGLLGDVHDGSMVVSRCDGDIDTGDYRESKTLKEGTDFLFPKEENDRFHNHLNEHFWFYNRGMICGMGSFLIRQNFVEPVTPFGDPDFLNVYLSTPWDMRVKGRLLRKWLLEKYPAAGKYTNQRNGLKLKYEVGPAGPFIGKVYKQIRKYYRKLFTVNPDDMNDFNAWYANNSDFRDYVDKNAADISETLRKYPAVASAMNKLGSSGNLYDKLIMMSINSIFRTFIE